ncbi:MULTISPECIES: ATP-binding protein [unclassified Paenibacillus]|uniref:sensor histidine kinase n=1 Tax=unclassified Paenibacillus TaxID=185978 RepID=UPI00104768C2|nr:MULTISPECIES: ATP-binding protein [unclassified Paenibacillus]NIK69735.1 signal transduction histidine kinase [Paenibacillus sp. BK720]
MKAKWIFTIRWRLMLIMLMSLGMTALALFVGYYLTGPLLKVKLFQPPIDWLVNTYGSQVVMLVTAVLCFPYFFFVASSGLVRDLRNVDAGLQDILEGRLGEQVKVGGRDELARVADSVNQVSSQLDHNLEEMIRGLEAIAEGQFDYRIPEMDGSKIGKMVSSINRMSERLHRSIQEERNAEKTKNDLITGVSHDLRTPLTSILGFLEVIEKDRYKDETELRYYVNIAYEKSLSLRRLIDDLFEYTRINNGMPLDLRQLDIIGLIGQLNEEFVPALEAAGMESRVDFQDESRKIMADGGLLVRAYENLISNAIQYGREGRYVDIELVCEEEDVIVRITNYGEPIPERDLPYIFDRFYRVERSRSKETGGTGLGLAITKSIIELHGGKITVQSSKRFTSFETRLPCSGPLKREGTGPDKLS